MRVRLIMMPLAIVLAAAAAMPVIDLVKPTRESAIDALCPLDDSPLAAVLAEVRSAPPAPLPAPRPVAHPAREAELAANQHLANAIAFDKIFRFSDEVVELTGAIHLDPTLVQAYEMRANAWTAMNRDDRAIEDYDKAVELGSLPARKWRGETEAEAGRYAEALADFQQAVRINPNDPEIYKEHGFSCAGVGRFQAAARDFEIALSVQPGNHYAVIWRYLMQRRLGEPAAQAELDSRADAIDPSVWPAPVVPMLRGQVKPEELAPIPDSSQADLEDFAIEAPFYRAEYHLVNGDRQTAIEEFRTVAAIRRYDIIETRQAEYELSRLMVETASR